MVSNRRYCSASFFRRGQLRRLTWSQRVLVSTELRIVDLGCAGSPGMKAPFGEAMKPGTPGYRAPEITLGEFSGLVIPVSVLIML